MGTRKRIAVHGLLAAGMLAVIGWMYAQLAGIYTARPVERAETTLAAAPVADDVAGTLAWRVPVGMATVGFLFVLVGEGLAFAWRKPAPAATPRPTPEQDAEALLQELLDQQDRAADERRSTPIRTNSV